MDQHHGWDLGAGGLRRLAIPGKNSRRVAAIRFSLIKQGFDSGTVALRSRIHRRWLL